MGGREGDLVEGRRRFRLVLAVGAGLAIAAFTILGALSDPQIRAYGSQISAGIVLVLALISATQRLGLRAEPELAAKPAGGTDLSLDPLAGAAVALDPEERALLDRLQQLMERDRIYREEGLGIAALAARLGLPEYRLRRLINRRLGHRNFTSFINGYRLAETIAALADPTQAPVPVLTIALDAGFQSIGPFNRAFKAQTGMTPTDFRRDRLERTAIRAAG
jgi:AraC-like DNA-binding protein